MSHQVLYLQQSEQQRRKHRTKVMQIAQTSGFPDACTRRFKRLFAEALFYAAFRPLFCPVFERPTGIPFDATRRRDQIEASPSMICTACPPTRTFETVLPLLLDLTKSLLGRLTSTPCRISTVSSGWATPYLTIQADVHPAADPVAGSSPTS